MKGWVYVITTKTMPNLVKVGFSTKDPELRAIELNNTGNPHPYKVEYDVLVNNPKNVEQATHDLLKSKNYHENKEWFNCSIEIAITAIRDATVGNILLESCESDIFLKKHITQQHIGKFIVQDGIATDIETDLMWCRFAYGQSWFNETAVGHIKRVDWQTTWEAVEQFNQQGGYAGYRDWRLPTMDELKTLVDRIKGKDGNYIDTDVFPNNDNVINSNIYDDIIYNTWFWSSSYKNSYSSFLVAFNKGVDSWDNDQGKNAVRFVRDKNKQLIGKFLVQDGIATSIETKLMWLCFTHGQTWQNGSAVGEVENLDWETALGVVKQFNLQGGYAGYTDWRMPTIDELKTLINKNIIGDYCYYIDRDVFEELGWGWFWSSSRCIDYPNFTCWTVSFNDGWVYETDHNETDYEIGLRLVRGKPFIDTEESTNQLHLSPAPLHIIPFPSPVQEFINGFIVEEGIAIDTKTGLTWLRFGYGQSWKNGKLIGNLKQVNWQSAFSMADLFNRKGGYAGYKDWRLPTLDELLTLLDKEKAKKIWDKKIDNYYYGKNYHSDYERDCITDTTVFPNNDELGKRFWTSSSYEGYSDFAWSVTFDDDNASENIYDKDMNMPIRFVRIGK
jgi:hypothetical protein